MAGLAAMLQHQGFEVRGSDQSFYPPMKDFLETQGIETLAGYKADQISTDLDLVVIGNAVSRGNPEVEAVLEYGIRYCSLPEIIRDQFLWQAHTLVFAGTHGKTSTAAMAAWVLVSAGCDPSFMIGGIPRNFGAGYRMGRGEMFVIEGDEYDSAFFDKTPKFLKYLPDIAVVNNVEYDHADIYKSVDDFRLAFRRFVRLVPRNGYVLLGADDEEAPKLFEAALCKVETFGLHEKSDWRAADVRQTSRETAFTLIYQERKLAEVTLPLLGTFNVKNALAAIAAAAKVGVDPILTANALGRFEGVSRRLEIRCVVDGITIYDDFAHHPSAVRASLSAVRSAVSNGRLWALFEPRSATACRRVFQRAFADALKLADEVIVGRVFRASLPKCDRLSESQLVADLEMAGVRARYISKFTAIVDTVSEEAKSGDHVVIMSNGDFGGIHERLMDRLNATRL